MSLPICTVPDCPIRPGGIRHRHIERGAVLVPTDGVWIPTEVDVTSPPAPEPPAVVLPTAEDLAAAYKERHPNFTPALVKPAAQWLDALRECTPTYKPVPEGATVKPGAHLCKRYPDAPQGRLTETRWVSNRDFEAAEPGLLIDSRDYESHVVQPDPDAELVREHDGSGS